MKAGAPVLAQREATEPEMGSSQKAQAIEEINAQVEALTRQIEELKRAGEQLQIAQPVLSAPQQID
jgi:prefoldin subunit 5